MGRSYVACRGHISSSRWTERDTSLCLCVGFHSKAASFRRVPDYAACMTGASEFAACIRSNLPTAFQTIEARTCNHILVHHTINPHRQSGSNLPAAAAPACGPCKVGARNQFAADHRASIGLELRRGGSRYPFANDNGYPGTQVGYRTAANPSGAVSTECTRCCESHNDIGMHDDRRACQSTGLSEQRRSRGSVLPREYHVALHGQQRLERWPNESEQVRY